MRIRFDTNIMFVLLRALRARLGAALAGLGLSLSAALPVFAGETDGNLPWNHPLQVLMDNITGPTMTTLLIIAVAAGVMMWGWSSHNDGVARVGKALVALAIIVILPLFLQRIGIGFALL